MGHRARDRSKRRSGEPGRIDVWDIGPSRWFLLPAAVSGFLLQHAVQGWCPPIPVLRRLGFRTSFEIEQERQALKLIRGDYKSVAAGDADAEDLLEAVQA